MVSVDCYTWLQLSLTHLSTFQNYNTTIRVGKPSTRCLPKIAPYCISGNHFSKLFPMGAGNLLLYSPQTMHSVHHVKPLCDSTQTPAAYFLGGACYSKTCWQPCHWAWMHTTSIPYLLLVCDVKWCHFPKNINISNTSQAKGYLLKGKGGYIWGLTQIPSIIWQHYKQWNHINPVLTGGSKVMHGKAVVKDFPEPTGLITCLLYCLFALLCSPVIGL